MSTTEKDWIESIRNGAEEELNKLYTLYREEFIAWSGSVYKLSTDEAADVFQDTVITFYWNIKKGKLSELSSTVKTYLFAIGKNLALKKMKKDRRMVIDNEVMEFNAAFEIDDLPIEHNERQKLLADLLANLGEPCKSILTLFYFDHFTMDSIAARLEYKSEHVVKSQKLRCLQRLRQLFESQSIDEEDF